MVSRSVSARHRAVLACAVAATMTLAFVPVDSGETTSSTSASEFAPQLVTVDTPTRDDKDRLTALGLDVTEHAGHDYVEVVLHTAAEAETLAAAGFSWDVRIPDLLEREAEIQAANREYAAATERSPMPSGRDSYRTLDDYYAEMDELAEKYPNMVEPIELSETSLEGRPIRGIEIASAVDAENDGRPTFTMFGLHHAREWPSGEHTIEFAYDLLNKFGKSERITRLLRDVRVILVPVQNPDGFNQSITDGMTLDLREVDDGDLVSIFATPNNAYKRKNCRVIDGQDTPPGACDAAKSPGGFGVGIDLNRNYGTFWGGPGASDNQLDPTYHGAGPFSEPETQAVRDLVSSRQVTTLISNHTFSNLVLRPNGVAPDTTGPDGFPVGLAPDEEAMKHLGAKMAAENGYQNIHGWELYDTTGTTEDWSYNATGGYGYTFEIGPQEFHPPYEQVIDEYVGDAEAAGDGGGNRAAYLHALENAADTAHHSRIRGKAPAGATLRLVRTGSTPTWEDSFTDRVETTTRVGDTGKFDWHVNPSTRPLVESRRYQVTGDEPLRSESYTGTTAPTQHTDEELTLERDDADLLEVTLDWPTPDDLDLYVYRREGDDLVELGSGTSFVGEKEKVLVEDPVPGEYVLRVENFASVAPQWEMQASLFETTTEQTPSLIEAWTLSCEVDGEVIQQVPVIVDRGDGVKADLKDCRRKARQR